MSSTAPAPSASRVDAGTPFLAVEDLRVHFPTDDGLVKSVDGLSFELQRGEILGIVGESGSGKSVTAQAILGLHKGSRAQITGHIWLDGEDLVTASEDDMRNVRGSEIAMIFQDPLSSLHPFYSIGDQIAEAYRVHNKVSAKDAKKRTIEMLEKVGIPNAAGRYDDYPHQFSGGMRQRAMIAMALICEPKLLIADEPTTALDVTVQAQILELIMDMCSKSGTALLLITHDLGVVAELCTEMITLYAGEVVERAGVRDALHTPRHPYTSSLLRSLPGLSAPKTKLPSIPGSVPSPLQMPEGCRFAPRCFH